MHLHFNVRWVKVTIKTTSFGGGFYIEFEEVIFEN